MRSCEDGSAHLGSCGEAAAFRSRRLCSRGYAQLSILLFSRGVLCVSQEEALSTRSYPSPVSLRGADLLLDQLYGLLQCLFNIGALQRLATPCLEALEANTRNCVCSTFLPYLSPRNSAASSANALKPHRSDLLLQASCLQSSADSFANAKAAPAVTVATATATAATATGPLQEAQEFSPLHADDTQLNSDSEDGINTEERQQRQQRLAARDREQTRTYSVLDAYDATTKSPPTESTPETASLTAGLARAPPGCFSSIDSSEHPPSTPQSCSSLHNAAAADLFCADASSGNTAAASDSRLLWHRTEGPLFRPPLPRSWSILRQESGRIHAMSLECAGQESRQEKYFTPLMLVRAFKRLDAVYRLSSRSFAPPSRNECRNLLNLAQIFASRQRLRLLTLDGDETLYPNGENFCHEEMGRNIAQLLRKGVAVAVVTGAVRRLPPLPLKCLPPAALPVGYGYEAEKYAVRLGILLTIFAQERLPPKATRRFFLMGGESNYLLRLSSSLKLEPVPEELWRGYRPPIEAADCERLLDVSERSLVLLSKDLGLEGNVIRKQRAVGLVPRDDATNKVRFGCVDNKGMHKESLEEGVMRVRRDIRAAFGGDCPVPYSVFTGGCDIWVDAGNKAEGVALLQGLLKLKPEHCLHVGDQFDLVGNDLAARICSPTLWIRNPKETAAVIWELLQADSENEEESSP
ncbi:uncharacterized protein LOC34618238 [Cyclospora cayetanensis]|uniref:IMP-specific 5'-nucleotidase 1 n=1 Tax=Cyclospora cayetanensis TaxID=88456 RepID=A0A6P6RYZ5_9EIME|nr:uncharacterized protein LOC34618238 [Cyclospora cayetanensis]